ncbi:MAG TPA: hypothetical protein VF276_07330, partial [Chloroflexia bacterium]
VLGVLLVLGVVSFAAGQAWDQQAKVTHYQAGSRAVNALDWARAAVEYGAAGAYRDAPAQAAQAASFLAERDRLYAAAQTAARRYDWPAVLDLLPRLRQLGPDYQETRHLTDVVAALAPGLALSGTVALRAGNGDPGLYSYLPDGWHRLPGSDRRSRVRAACPDGDLVYDGLAFPGTLDAQTDPMAGRRLLRAARDGTRMTPLALDLVFGSVACTRGGVWGLSDQGALPGNGGSRYLTEFQATGASRAVTPTLPSPLWSVVDLIPDDRLLVLSNTVPLDAQEWRTQLYATAPDGSHPQLLDERPGLLDTTLFSPDGRYLLVAVNNASFTGPQVDQAIALVDMTGAAPPRELITARTTEGSEMLLYGMRGVWIRQGPHAGQVLLIWTDATGQVIRQIDPEHPDAVVREVHTDRRYLGLHLLSADADGGLVLADLASAGPSYSRNSTLLYLDPRGGLREMPVPFPEAGAFANSWTRAGRLVYATGLYGSQGEGPRFVVSSIPLDQFGVPGAQPTEIYSGVLTQDGIWPVLPWRAGPGLLAYTTPQGQLHARTYTTGADIPLEAGVLGFSMIESYAGDAAP